MTHKPAPTESGFIRIGDWRVSLSACTLQYCADGAALATDSSAAGTQKAAPDSTEETKVTPRSMDVLKYLAERPGTVVSPTELLENLWQSPIATDHAVHKAIAELRSALHDNAHKPSYIKTIPKRGYTLIAPVTPWHSETEQAPTGTASSQTTETFATVDGSRPVPSTATWIKGMAVAAIMAVVAISLPFFDGSGDVQPEADEVITLVVLPFVTQDLNDENLILAEGIRDSLVHNLAKLSHLQVLSPPREPGYLMANFDSSHQYSRQAEHLLRGSVYSAQGRLRVIVQLFRTSDGVQEYSDQFDLQLDDIFAVQDEIAANVVSALRIHLDEQERSQMRDWGTTNALAYQAFLRGEFYYNQWSPEDFHKAIDYYLMAVELDPDFLNAYAGVATAANNLAVYSSMDKISELYGTVIGVYREVYRIDPESEILDSIRAIKLRMQGTNYVQQEMQLRELVLSGSPPDFAIAHYALLLIGARMYDEASQLLDLVSDNSPFQISPDEVWSYRHSVKTPQNLLMARRSQLQQRPYHIGFLGTTAVNLAFLGDFRQAQVYLDQLRRVDSEGIIAHYSTVVVDFLAGNIEAGSQSMRDALIDDPDYYYNNGALSFMLGDIDRGIHYWSQLQPVQLRRLYNMAQVSEKLFPDRVLESPQYHALLAQLGPGIQWQRHLMEGVTTMAPITGVELNPKSRAAYENEYLMIRNNLWSDQDWLEFELHKAERTGNHAYQDRLSLR